MLGFTIIQLLQSLLSVEVLVSWVRFGSDSQGTSDKVYFLGPESFPKLLASVFVMGVSRDFISETESCFVKGMCMVHGPVLVRCWSARRTTPRFCRFDM